MKLKKVLSGLLVAVMFLGTLPVKAFEAGWNQVGNDWVYVNEDGSKMTGWMKEGDCWYFFNEDGTMYTGWLANADHWYYMGPSGVMQTNTTVEENGVQYYLKSTGVMARNFYKDGYEYDENGVGTPIENTNSVVYDGTELPEVIEGNLYITDEYEELELEGIRVEGYVVVQSEDEIPMEVTLVDSYVGGVSLQGRDSEVIFKGETEVSEVVVEESATITAGKGFKDVIDTMEIQSSATKETVVDVEVEDLKIRSYGEVVLEQHVENVTVKANATVYVNESAGDVEIKDYAEEAEVVYPEKKPSRPIYIPSTPTKPTSDTWDGTVDTSWYSETATTYTLDSAEDLAGLAQLVNGGNTFEGKTINLDIDVDLQNTEWTPIGTGTRDGSTAVGNVFAGTFNGNNHTISKLTITSGTEKDAVGLFGVVTGTVNDITVKSVAVNTNAENTGAIAGIVVGGTINGCTVNGSVTAPDGVGGVVGRMLVEGTISNCENASTVTATNGAAGGIVSKAYYTTTEDEKMIISDCVNTGVVTATYAAGGIAGLSAAEVTDCENSADITANAEAGGIVAEQVNRGEISGCTNSGTITVDNGTTAGGIVGWIRYQKNSSYGYSEVILVDSNENNGNINASGSSLGAGGIVGSVYNQATITNNTNTCASVTGGTFAAGIAGNLQEESSGNLVLTDETITVSGNTYTTSTVITATCTDPVAYNNKQDEFKVENSHVIAEASTVAELESIIAENDEATIILDAAISLSDSGLVINNDKTIEIDLNGNTLSGNYTTATATALIINKGTLTIRDSTGNGKIVASTTTPDTEEIPSYANNTITNMGDLTIESGILENKTGSGACYVIDNNSTNGEVSLTVNGGTIQQTGGNFAIRQFANGTNTNEVEINGGEISGKRAVWIHLPGSNSSVAPNATLTVNDGTLTSTDNGENGYYLAVYSYSYGNSFANTEITVNGGTFVGDIALGGGYKGDTETFEDKGGTYTGWYGVYRWLADGSSETIVGITQ